MLNTRLSSPASAIGPIEPGGRVDNLVFNTDYPHPDGTWPWGMGARLEEQPIPEARASDNATRAFRLAA